VTKPTELVPGRPWSRETGRGKGGLHTTKQKSGGGAVKKRGTKRKGKSASGAGGDREYDMWGGESRKRGAKGCVKDRAGKKFGEPHHGGQAGAQTGAGLSLRFSRGEWALAYQSWGATASWKGYFFGGVQNLGFFR